MSLDLVILFSGFLSVGLLVLFQTIVFRLVHPDAVLKWIMNIFIATSVLHMAGVIIWNGLISHPFEGSFFMLAIVSYLIFAMTAFVYILCVFGPSETSIRIRLIRELYEQKGGRLTHEALLANYNGGMILKRRIQRLLLAGEITERDGTYEIKNKSNTFFLIDLVAGLIQKFIRKSA